MKVTDRYLFSSKEIKKIQKECILTNLKYNKKLDLMDNELEEYNHCQIIASIVNEHKNVQGTLFPVYYEILFDNINIIKHQSLPLFLTQKNVGNFWGSVAISENLRVNQNPNLTTLIKELFDNKYGIFSNIYKDISSIEYAMVGVEFKPFMSENTIETGYGRGKSFEEAETQAILEALERLAMYRSENKANRYLVKDGLKNTILLQEFQKIKDEEIEFIEVYNLKSKTLEWLPKQLFIFNEKMDSLAVLETSNGMALGSTYYESLLFSLLEFIERDSFLVYWHKQITLRRVNKKSLNEQQQNVISQFETHNKKVYLFDMRFDIDIPTILALVISFDEKPATYVSSASHINHTIAVDNALKEVIVAHNIYRNNPITGEKKFVKKEDVQKLSDHFNYYSGYESIELYQHLLDTEQEYDIAELFEGKPTIKTDKEAVEYILEKLSFIQDIYCCNYEMEVLNQIGFSCTKVIIPEMQTMYFGYKNRRINIKRIDQAIDQSIYKNQIKYEEGEFYDEPHPFP
ncbi:ribosomal protein S12 methylthiotransferase accessory factor [Enterococcus rotai]|uniref:YcaO domain-containing protein n=1 Tax=Enterococcus rotai TaxID=118060 RepID=A0A0U2VWM9_9ENTE|nr:YcaO-like family protein [Enterococcus rotai]ALS37684.1 hypothetical protein ATZ35_11140 [Enterococcus rotai]